MQVSVNLFAHFRNGRFKEDMQDLEPGTRVVDIVKSLGIGEEEVGIIMVNGRGAELDRELQDGERLSLFPLVGGG